VEALNDQAVVQWCDFHVAPDLVERLTGRTPTAYATRARAAVLKRTPGDDPSQYAVSVAVSGEKRVPYVEMDDELASGRARTGDGRAGGPRAALQRGVRQVFVSPQIPGEPVRRRDRADVW